VRRFGNILRLAGQPENDVQSGMPFSIFCLMLVLRRDLA
jgi:hypothetical protein